MHPGKRLAAWRAHVEGRSQAKAAAEFKVSQAAWAAWESGKKAPDLGNALRLETHTDGAIRAVDWVPASEAVTDESAALSVIDNDHSRAS